MHTLPCAGTLAHVALLGHAGVSLLAFIDRHAHAVATLTQQIPNVMAPRHGERLPWPCMASLPASGAKPQNACGLWFGTAHRTRQNSHASMVKRFLPECASSVFLLCDFIAKDEGLAGADVPDPIGMGSQAYEEVAAVIELALPGIIGLLNE